MKVLCIGHCTYDISLPVDEYPEENKKYRLEEREEGGGGPAANAAYLMAKWGVDTYFAGIVGNDDFGKKITKEFQEIGIHTEFLETTYEFKTSLSFILVNKKTGSRTVFNLPTEYVPLKKCEPDFLPDLILVDGHDFYTSKRILTKHETCISMIDAGRPKPEIIDLCKLVKYIVCSKEFAEGVTKLKFDFEAKDTFIRIYQEMKNKFPKAEIVITLEDHGVIYCQDEIIKLMPAMQIDEVDTTGAGDIFHGAFAYGLVNGFDLEKTIRYANIAAGISCTRLNARNSMPTLEEVEVEYAKNI